MKFISRTLVVLVLVCFSVPNVNEAQADRILLTMPAILASPNIIKDPTPSPPPLPLFGTVVSAGGRVWMDRNLGASQVATSPTDSAAYGDLYQWGRGTDGHESRTSPTTTVLSSSDAPQHDNFILALSSPFDWRNPRNNNLWQGVSGINNPGPRRFQITHRNRMGDRIPCLVFNRYSRRLCITLKARCCRSPLLRRWQGQPRR